MSNSIDSRSTQTVSPTDYAKFDPDTIHQKLNSSLSLPQLNNDGSIRHFLGVEGLNKAQLQAIIAKAETFFDEKVNDFVLPNVFCGVIIKKNDWRILLCGI